MTFRLSSAADGRRRTLTLAQPSSPVKQVTFGGSARRKQFVTGLTGDESECILALLGDVLGSRGALRHRMGGDRL
ncbi:hypothetical protein [Streptomyces sp. NPDC048565]|uniref:hypothetical protein n=1 Tax=Streptomyces sp. NPDC048565 TaxID=3155266 RepID=UPI003449650C